MPGPTPYYPLAAYGAPRPWRELDQSSLVGFALALTGIAAPVGVVLGIRGLKRTADGTRSGRWAAILAIVVGILATLVIAAAVVGMTWFRDKVRTTERVETGTCVDLDDSGGVVFYPRSCTEPHQGEVVATGDFRGRASLAFVNATPAEFCFRMTDKSYRSLARTGDYSVSLVVSNEDPRDPDPDDSFACVYGRSDGRLLRDRLATEEGA